MSNWITYKNEKPTNDEYKKAKASLNSENQAGDGDDVTSSQTHVGNLPYK